MRLTETRTYSLSKQFLVSTSFVLLASLVCFFTAHLIGYKVVALILLLVVSILAALFDIYPVLVNALLSALIWNFFFIPPTFTLHVGSAEDGLLFLMYFVIAMINAVLTFNIRKYEEKARDREEKAKEIKLYNTLLNTLSHELKTPITTIIGSVDTLQENGNRLADDQKNELYSEIFVAGTRLNRQVENLLGLSRLEAGMLKPRTDWCDLNELVFTVLENYQGEAGHHQILFEPKDLFPLFRTDRVFIEQILHNLVHNAIRYTPDHTAICIALSTEDQGFTMTVSDKGQGFPQDMIELVFEKFYRLPKNQTGGTGLGLSIVKGFTEALRGSVSLENNRDGGACFKVFVPAQSTPSNHSENE